MKAALDWPEKLQCESASTKRLKRRIAELEEMVKSRREEVADNDRDW